MVARFGEISGWEAKKEKGRHGCGLWKSIQKMFEVFWKYIRFNQGSGSEISFWNDRWIGESTLKESSRMLHSLAVDHLVRVMNYYYSMGDIWVPRLHRNLND